MPDVAVYGLEHRLTLVVDERIRACAYRTPWGWHVPTPHQRGRVAWTACPDKATAAALLYARGNFMAANDSRRRFDSRTESRAAGGTRILKGAPWTQT